MELSAAAGQELEAGGDPVFDPEVVRLSVRVVLDRDRVDGLLSMETTYEFVLGTRFGLPDVEGHDLRRTGTGSVPGGIASDQPGDGIEVGHQARAALFTWASALTVSVLPTETETPWSIVNVNSASLLASKSDTFSKKRIEGSSPKVGAIGPPASEHREGARRVGEVESIRPRRVARGETHLGGVGMKRLRVKRNRKRDVWCAVGTRLRRVGSEEDKAANDGDRQHE